MRVGLSGPGPAIHLLVGASGDGKSLAVTEAVRDMAAVRYWAAPLTDADHRALLVEQLGRWREGSPIPGGNGVGPELPPEADWPQIFDHLLARAGERTTALRLIFEEFSRLVEVRPKLLPEVERFWSRVRARALPIHLVLTGSEVGALAHLVAREEPWGPWVEQIVRVGPRTFRQVGALFPAYTARDRLLTWAVFGGSVRNLSSCDAEVALQTNVRQLLLSPGSPLLREGFERLQRDLQSIPRYASVLRALARGARDWGEILAGAPEFAAGAQMAPYLSRLQELGIVSGEASLDAKPGSRSRRYRIRDPYLCFWHRFVLPSLADILDGRAVVVWRERIRPSLDAYAASLFPMACREYLAHYGHERLPADAREHGGLWGAGYEIEVAGTLRTGAAVYGKAIWGGGRVPESVDEELHQAVRRTRYGFGKEARLRLLFATDGFSSGLVRRGARSEATHLIPLEALYGG